MNLFFQLIFNVITTSDGKEEKQISFYTFGEQNILTVSFHLLLLPWPDAGEGEILWHLVLINLPQFSHGHSTF